MRKISKKKKLEQCRICHKKSYYVSENGLCPQCCANKIKSAQMQIKAKEGPVYEKWKEKIIKSVERL